LISADFAKYAFRLLALFTLILNIGLSRTIRRKYLIGLLAIFFITSLNKSEIAANIIFLLTIAISLSRQSAREVAIIFAIPTTIVVLAHGFLLLGGLIYDQQTSYFDRQRSTLGFANTNQVSAIYLSLAAVAVFCHVTFKSKFSLFFGAVAIAVAAFVFQLTDSRTSFLTLILLVSLHILGAALLRLRSYRLILALSASLTFAAGTLATYYVTTSHDAELDFLLSFRPYFFALFMKNVTVSDFLLGWSTSVSGGTDSGYLMLLSGVGAVVYFLFLLAVSVRMFRIDYLLLPILISLLVGSTFESFLIRPELPVSPLFFYLMLSRSSLRPSNYRT